MMRDERQQRFTCCVCWRKTSWNHGCADQADEVCSLANVRKHGTTDTGICDECWSALAHGGDLTGHALRPATGRGEEE